VRERARQTPDDVAVESVDGERLTYAEADRAARRWGGVLRALGVGPGDTVVTLLPAVLAALPIWLGASLVRAVEVGANPELRGPLLTDLLADARARVAVTTPGLLERLLDAATDEAASVEVVVVLGADAPLPRHHRIRLIAASEVLADATDADDDPPAPHETACVIYTSGTTGASKGVIVPWGQLDANCQGSIELYRRGDVYYSPFALHHASGRLPFVFMALVGGRVVLRERFSSSAFWQDVRAHGCTTTSLPGTIAAMLASRPATPEDADNPLRFVTMIPLVDDIDGFRERFAVAVRTMYNQTELSSPISSPGVELADPRSCGRLRPGYEARLVDEHDEEVAPGTVGELVLRADRPWSLLAGYLGRSEATARAWRNGWLHTGDLFRVSPEGDYFLVDRRTDSIRRRGENISSTELERLALRHPRIAEAAAVGVPAELGEEEILLFAVPAEGAELHPAEVRDHLASMAPRHLVPRYIDVVAELPRTTAMRRVQKSILRARGVTTTTWDGERTS
jgi:crotonobetaine/carnitine-CoA ligase